VSTIFVTGTGTDVGKTFVTAGIIRRLRATGQKADALKPVISGYDPATVMESDSGILLGALGRDVTAEAVERMSPWRYRAPLSPDMAADREGKTVDVGAVIAYCLDRIASSEGTLLIEGVGDIMVPLDGSRTVLDLMVGLAVPVVLVAGSYLGALSHTLTALDVLVRARLEVRALVVNESAGSTVALDDTVATLARFARGIEVIAVSRLARGDETHPAFGQIVNRLH
jgi:dethiobiotin synthetase